MRFVISGEWTKNSLLGLIITFFLFYTFILWLTNGMLFFHKMGLSYQGVVDYYLGSESKYIQPRSYQGILEVTHFHMFAMGILLLTLTHLLLFVPLANTTKALLTVCSFSSAFLDEASGWLIRFVHPGFAWLKIISFLALEGSMLVVMVLVANALIRKKPSAYTDSQRGP